MKNNTLILILGIITYFASCSDSGKEAILVDGNEFPPLTASAIKEPYPDNPDKFKVTIKDNQGNVLEEGEYNSNLREGAWTIYHTNGYPKEILSYVAGQKHGIWLTLDNRGQLLERAYFYNDSRNGPYIKYNRSRIKEEHTYRDGVLSGSFKKFYDNGKIMEESNYVDGKLDGLARWYDQEGNVTIEYEYKNGEWINPEAN